jgi:hypothetical protein
VANCARRFTYVGCKERPFHPWRQHPTHTTSGRMRPADPVPVPQSPRPCCPRPELRTTSNPTQHSAPLNARVSGVVGRGGGFGSSSVASRTGPAVTSPAARCDRPSGPLGVHPPAPVLAAVNRTCRTSQPSKFQAAAFNATGVALSGLAHREPSDRYDLYQPLKSVEVSDIACQQGQ